MCVFENVHVIQNAPFFGRFFCVKKNKKIYRRNVRLGKRGIFENAHFLGTFFSLRMSFPKTFTFFHTSPLHAAVFGRLTGP